MFLNKLVEQLSRPELAEIQVARLKTMLTRVYEKSLFYEKRMNELGILPQDIESLNDIIKLPFTTKADLLQNYPYGLLTMPISGTIRFQAAQKIALGLTGQDIYQQMEAAARSLVACNVLTGSIIMLLSHNPACRAVQQAAEGIGVTVLEIAAAENRLAALTDFGVTQLCGTKEDLQRFADDIKKNPALESTFLLQSLLVCTDEYPLPAYVTDRFTIPNYALYGPHEFAPASLAGECHCQNGLHVNEDSFYVEIIDKESKLLPPGQAGELVVTTLTREAMPLLRYRTGKTAVLDAAPCPCGRNSVRISKLSAK